MHWPHKNRLRPASGKDTATIPAMRVIFVGNVSGYSARILAALAARSIDPTASISLAAVICPVSLDTRREAFTFALKRRVGRLLDSRLRGDLPQPVRSYISDRTDGMWHQMQKLAGDTGAIMLWPQKMTEPGLLDQVASMDADLVIVAGLDRILRERSLQVFPRVFNLHPSLLPKYRGPSPEFWQLDAGETEGGVTMHVIDAGIDTGPIVLQRRFSIEPWLDADGLMERGIEVGIALMHELLDRFPDIAADPTPQADGSYHPEPRPEDRLVPFEHPAEAVFNRARAVGFKSPLLVHVPQQTWHAGEVNLQASHQANGEHLTLELYEAVPYPNLTQGDPGLLTRTPTGGVVISCSPGVVEFRRVVVAAPGERRSPRT